MDAETPEAREHVPLKPVVFYILLALAERASHGYGVIQSVRARSGGRVYLQTGPFYRHLRKLMDQGFVEESETRPRDDDVRRGAYYRLTSLGRAVLAEESRRLSELVDTTRSLGLLTGGPTS